MKGSLQRLLSPQSVAVFGGGWASSVIEQCQKMGFQGDIWPVHPTRNEVHELPCYRSVDELPAPPDASFVGVNRNLSIDIVAELSRYGAGGAVCFASGFDEASSRDVDGVSLQSKLVAAAGEMPIIGPNCYGFINCLDGALLWPDQHGARRLESDQRGVALLLQSSNIAINLTMQQRHLPIAYVVCAGNQAQTDMAKLASALLGDERVTAIGMYLEGISDVAGFEQFASMAHEKNKPVVVLKAGKSDAARAAVLTHTASMAGSDAASRAFFRQLGVACVDSLPQLLEALKLLHFCGSMAGRNICSISCSGGEASIMADAAQPRRLNFPALSKDQSQRVADTLSELVTISNPLDYHTFIWGDEVAMTNTFASMFECGFDLAMMVLDFPRRDRCDDGAWICAINAIVAAKLRTSANVAVVATLPENIDEVQAMTFTQHGIAPLQGIDDAMVAAEVAADIGEYHCEPPTQFWSFGEAVSAAPLTRNKALDEHESKTALAAAGVAVPQGWIINRGDDLSEKLDALSFPLVAKALGIDHKTERNAVLLDIQDMAALRVAVETLHQQSARILVEQQFTQSVCELLVGAHRDPVYGPMLTLAAGGVLVELLNDSIMLRLPVNKQQIRTAFGQLKCWPMLTGFRGRPVADVDALVDCVLNLQYMLAASEQEPNGLWIFDQIDINPLMVGAAGQGVVAADALIQVTT